MKKLKRILSVSLCALMLVTSLDLSGVTSLRAYADEPALEETVEISETAETSDEYEDILETGEDTENDINLSEDNSENDFTEDEESDVSGNVIEEDIDEGIDVSGNEVDTEEEIDASNEVNSDAKVDVNNDAIAPNTETFVTVDAPEGIVQFGGFLKEENSSAQKGDGQAFYYNSSESDKLKAIEALYNGAIKMQSSIDISQYHITEAEISEVFSELLNSHPDLFFVARRYSYYYGQYVTNMILYFEDYNKKTYTPDQVKIMQADFNNRIEMFKDGLHPEWCDLERLLYINSFVDKNCLYDPGIAYGNEPTNVNCYNAYGVLVDGVAVCNGYSLAVNYLCEIAEVPCAMITSRHLNHAWNLVKVDGQVYHLDVTWNDPVSDQIGRARHEYFLKSGSVFTTHHVNGVKDWVTQIGWDISDANSTKYDNYFWNDVNTGAAYGGNHTWYLYNYYKSFSENVGLYSYTCDVDTRTLSINSKIADTGTVKEDGYFYSYAYTGVGTYDGMIYYNFHDKIYEYNPATGLSSVVYSLSSDELSKGFISGMVADSKTIKYGVGKLYSSSYTIYTYTLPGRIDVRFNGNGSTGGFMTKQTLRGTGNLHLNSFEKTGYAFEGWNTKADGSGISYADGASITPTDDLTLYAQWRKITGAMFDANGGSGLSYGFKEYTINQPYGELPIVSKTGYDFLGWFTAKSGGTLITEESIFKNDITLYAHWEAKNIFIYFDANCSPFAYNITFESKTYTYDKAYSSLPAVACSDAAFLGWFTDPEGGEEITASSIVELNEDSVLYAHWTNSSYSGNYSNTFNNIFVYSVHNGCVSILYFTENASGAISIPATIDGYPVNRIFSGALSASADVTSISIPTSVGIIDAGAFDCFGGKLSKITVASDNKFFTAADGVLFNKNKTKLLCIPAAKAGKYTVPSTVTEISDYAISSRSLSGLTIGDNVTTISATNFKYLIAPVTVSTKNSNFASISGTLYNKSLTKLLYSPEDFSSLPEIPATVTEIGDYAFYNDFGESLIIPDSITEIGSYAFGCNTINEVFIPSSVYKIGDNAFYYCYSLSDIYFAHTKSNTLLIEDEAFSVYSGIDTTIHVPDKNNINPAISGYDWANRNVTYESDMYSLSYELNGGTQNDANPTYYTNFGSRTLYAPTRTGYDFTGWYSDADFINGPFSVVPVGITKVYAKWAPVDCEVILDPNGGIVPADSVFVKYKSPYGELPEASRSNYNFLGWYDGPDDEATLISAQTVNNTLETQTLYAHWEIKYTVSDPEFSIASETEVTAGERLKLSTLTEGARIYYTLDGTEPVEDESLLYDDEIVITENVTIKARAFMEDYNPSSTATASYTVKDESEFWGDLGENTEDLKKIREEIAENNPAFSGPSDVKATDIPDELWVAGITDLDYTGAALTQPDMRVYRGTKLLTLNTDYTVKYTSNTKAGTATVVITGKGNFAGTINTDFAIRQLDISLASAADIKLIFNKNVQKGAPVLTYELGGKTITLKNNTDYTLTYPGTDSKDKEHYSADAFKAANTDPGYEIIITGKGNYTGTKTVHEFIYDNAVNVSSLTYTLKNTPFDGGNFCMPGTGSAIKKGTTVFEWDNDIKIADNSAEAQNLLNEATSETPYSLIAFFENNTDIGDASVTFIGIPVKGYAGTVTKKYKITGTALSKAKFSADLTKTYNWEPESISPVTGKEIKPVVPIGNETQAASLTIVVNKVSTELKGIELSAYESLIEAGRRSDTRAYDYTYEYQGDVRNAGSIRIVFTGINGYTGSVTKTYKIKAMAVSSLGVRGINSSYTYTGNEITVSDTLEVFIKATSSAPEEVLVEGDDYTVTYQKNINAGTATVIITGINCYTGTIKKAFKITAYKLTDPSISLKEGDILGSFNYEKNGTKPSVTIKDSQTGTDYTLVAGKDYTLSYSGNNAVNDGSNPKSMPKVQITGKGNYTGTINCYFTITRTDISEGIWNGTALATDIVFKKSANVCNPTVTVTDVNGVKLAAGTDYTAPKIASGMVYYAKDCTVSQTVNKETVLVSRTEGDLVDKADIIPVGALLKAKIEASTKAASKYSGSRFVYYRVIAANISSATIKINAQTHTGKPILLDKDDISVKVGKTTLEKTDYEIVSYENNINKGTAKVTIKGVGNYGGTKTATFTIAAKTMNYTICYDANNAYMAEKKTYAPAATGTMKNSSTASKAKLTSNSYKRNAYTFAGWNTKPDGSGASYTNSEVFKIKEGMVLYGTTVKLYAQWTPVEYKITYKLNGGTAENPATYTIESDEIILSIPTKGEDFFEGWYQDSAFKKPLDNIPAHSTGNKTFYAKWKVVKRAGSYSENQIWDYLLAKISNEYGVAGLMGNLFAESGLKFNNMENSYESKLGYNDESYTKAVDDGTYKNFANDAVGYGLAQWTYHTRKQALYDLAKSRGTSISDAETQLDYLMIELTGTYKAVLNLLMTATSVEEASNNFLIGFEKPKNPEGSKAKRAQYGQNYYVRYAKGTVDTPPILFYVRVNTPSLRVRTGPGAQYPQSGSVSAGQEFAIVEQYTDPNKSEDNHWGRLLTGGWICLDYVIIL